MSPLFHFCHIVINHFVCQPLISVNLFPMEQNYNLKARINVVKKVAFLGLTGNDANHPQSVISCLQTKICQRANRYFCHATYVLNKIETLPYICA